MQYTISLKQNNREIVDMFYVRRGWENGKYKRSETPNKRGDRFIEALEGVVKKEDIRNMTAKIEINEDIV